METILCVLEYQFLWRRTCFLYEKIIYYYQFNVYFVISSYKTVIKNILMCVRESSTLYYMVAHSLHDCTAVWQQNSHQFRGARITVSLCYHNLFLIRHRTSHFGKLSLLAPVPGSRVRNAKILVERRPCRLQMALLVELVMLGVWLGRLLQICFVLARF